MRGVRVLAQSVGERVMREIDWAGLLVDEDAEGLWNGLFQLVSRHPAVRPLHFATDGAAVSSQTEINADLAQELFLELFQKRRFDHYASARYRSIDIENELSRIEIPNLVGARLRKRYPESFRMARRVSSLLKTGARFRRFGADAGESETSSSPDKKKARRGRPQKVVMPSAEDAARLEAILEEDDNVQAVEDSSGEDYLEPKQNGNGAEPRRRRMVSQVFGLREWPRTKPASDSGHF